MANLFLQNIPSCKGREPTSKNEVSSTRLSWRFLVALSTIWSPVYRDPSRSLGKIRQIRWKIDANSTTSCLVGMTVRAFSYFEKCLLTRYRARLTGILFHYTRWGDVKRLPRRNYRIYRSKLIDGASRSLANFHQSPHCQFRSDCTGSTSTLQYMYAIFTCITDFRQLLTGNNSLWLVQIETLLRELRFYIQMTEQEQILKMRNHIPTLEEYMRCRMGTSAVSPSLAFHEYVHCSIGCCREF